MDFYDIKSHTYGLYGKNELYIYGMSTYIWNGFNWNGGINEVE